MTRRTKLLLTGCLTPLLLICLCGVAVYLQPDLVSPIISRFLPPTETEQVLEELSENALEPAVDWEAVEEEALEVREESDEGDKSSEVPQPVIVQSDIVRVKVQNQTAQIEPAAMGISQAVEMMGDDGQPSFVFEYDEANLNSFLLPAIAQQMPPEIAAQISLNQIDLVPGAISIVGDFDTGLLGVQPLNITVAVSNDKRSLEIIGVNVGGFALEALGIAQLEEALNQAESEINRSLNGVAVVSSSGEELPLNELFIGEGIMQAVFKN